MKIAGRSLMILAALALVRGLWLLSPVVAWIGAALILYCLGHALFGADGRTAARASTPPVIVDTRSTVERCQIVTQAVGQRRGRA